MISWFRLYMVVRITATALPSASNTDQYTELLIYSLNTDTNLKNIKKQTNQKAVRVKNQTGKTFN